MGFIFNKRDFLAHHHFSIKENFKNIFYTNLNRNYTDNPHFNEIPKTIGIDSLGDYEELTLKFNYQVRAAEKVLSHLSLSDVLGIGEIGGSPFIQALVFSKNTSAHFFLSDRSESLIRPIENLGIFERTTFLIFDANVDDLQIFDKCDLLMMWGVDTLLSDKALLRILSFCKESGKKFLCASRDCETSRPRLISKIRLTITSLMMDAKVIKGYFTGCDRTSSYFYRLAELVGVECQQLGVFEKYRIYMFNPGKSLK